MASVKTYCIAFHIFSCRILIVSYKMVIITVLSNGRKNQLTIYGILCESVTTSLSSCFVANDNHIKVVWLHVAVFSEHDILHFWDNVNLCKYYSVKVTRNCFSYFNCFNQTWIKVSKFSFALDKKKNWFKVFVNYRNETVM